MLARVDQSLQFQAHRLCFRAQRNAPAQVHEHDAIDNFLYDKNSHADSSKLALIIQIRCRDHGRQQRSKCIGAHPIMGAGILRETPVKEI
jgi:hypothetical protein